MFTYNQQYGKIQVMFLKFKEVMIGGVNKKVDKKIIFIIKLRGVVEGLYLEIKKHMKMKSIINIYFGRLIKC